MIKQNMLSVFLESDLDQGDKREQASFQIILKAQSVLMDSEQS